jgi:hypothetical protein
MNEKRSLQFRQVRIAEAARMSQVIWKADKSANFLIKENDIKSLNNDLIR